MISFYKDDSGVVVYKDDTYLATQKFAIDRPATDADIAAYPDEHAAFVAATTPAAPTPAEPTPADSTPAAEGSA